jgi:hemin uptake protein HemP
LIPNGGHRDTDPDPAERRAGSALHSAALFGDAREIVILHRGQEYRLRITKTDKLILTK